MTKDNKALVLLGSTGSIGTQTLDVAEQAGYTITGLTASRNIAVMEQQIRQFYPKWVAMADETAAADLKVRVADCAPEVLSGAEGVCTVAAASPCDMVLNAIVGVAGLRPTMAAIAAGRNIALANKETLVAGGAAVTAAIRKAGVSLYPVDSEHSAIFQCLQAAPPDRAVNRLILTASGGPFFGRAKDQLEAVTPEDTLKHPNWDMGAKITVDCATMMNKGLEVIEAYWLFGVELDKIDVVVHRESIIHSMVEYVDGSVLAQMGVPDMRIPIQYALTYPNRLPSPVKQLRLEDWKTLTFYEQDRVNFPAIDLCRQALTRGGTYPAALNAANEEAVALFLQKKIGFCDITRMAGTVLDMTLPEDTGIDTVLETDAEIRRHIRQQASC